MTHFPLIGITGYAGVGKSTVASYLMGDGYEVVKFAAPLKDMLRKIGLTEEEIEGPLKDKPSIKLGDHTPRFAMQTLGSDWGRKLFGANFWVNIAVDKAAKIILCGGRVVIDDVRFPNEEFAIRHNGGVILKINRPGVGPINSHVSDNQRIEADAEIVNSGDVIDLCDAVDFALHKLAIKRGLAAGVRAPFAADAFVL